MKIIIISVVVLFAGFLGSASLVPFSAIHSVPHTWLPIPAACAGYACVTWQQLRRAGADSDNAADVLTVLLEDRAFSVIARAQGVNITDDDVQLALEAADRVMGASPAADAVAGVHHSNDSAPLFRNDPHREMRMILMREQLISNGVTDPFREGTLSPIRIFTFHARWDEHQGRIVHTTPPWISSENPSL